MGRSIFREVPYYLRRRRADVGQRLEVLDLPRRASQGGHRLGSPLVAEHTVVGFVFDLQERRYRLQRPDDVVVLQGARSSFCGPATEIIRAAEIPKRARISLCSKEGKRSPGGSQTA